MDNNQKIFICTCHSYEHQVIFRWDEEDKQLYATVHLTNHSNIFKRIIAGVQYIFGHTSRYGEWDEFIFKPEDQEELTKWLKSKENYEK